MDSTLTRLRIASHTPNAYATIAYMNGDGIARVRTISDIHEPQIGKDGALYVKAHDDFRDAPRTFRLDRLQPLAFWQKAPYGPPKVLAI